MTTAGLALAAAELGVSSLEPEAIALAVSGLMVKRARAYIRRWSVESDGQVH